MENQKVVMDAADVVARTVWGEARGCGSIGMQHVCNVIVNRVNHPSWWGNSFVEVCQEPDQFSCWNNDDPNRAKLVAVTEADREFSVALKIAAQAISGALPDLTQGADSYYAISMKTPPAWAKKAYRTIVDGWHAFYRTVPGANAGGPANVSYHASVAQSSTADELNSVELTKINEQKPIAGL